MVQKGRKNRLKIAGRIQATSSTKNNCENRTMCVATTVFSLLSYRK